jgi:hypothetical protein
VPVLLLDSRILLSVRVQSRIKRAEREEQKPFKELLTGLELDPNLS